ncbi:tigger transposable element-derived protein 6-like protein [Plakobranchus ocellatus]|uniref:Tigger transposable element-derived protein 6-like protein n=1 Tax=Plakobranchus ocellatus TaxID=259542 RepID=A0AAV4CDS7_9GAST|nr:tigger transposable element-derived protein 6-like protein [Plakobranchus ocellatus]
MSARRSSEKARKDLSIVVQKVLNAEGGPTPFKDNMPGRKWLHSFLKRHEELRVMKTMVLGEQRAGLSKEKIQAWFKDVAANLSEDGIDISSVEPGCIFKADEKASPSMSNQLIVATASETTSKSNGPGPSGDGVFSDKMDAIATSQYIKEDLEPTIHDDVVGYFILVRKSVHMPQGRRMYRRKKIFLCLAMKTVFLTRDLLLLNGLQWNMTFLCLHMALLLDKYTDSIISSGWTMSDLYLIRRRQFTNESPKEGQEQYRQYVELYNQMVPPINFDTLPLPEQWQKKKNNQNKAAATKIYLRATI